MWVLTDIKKLKNPVPYIHKSGSVTWVTLDEPTTKKVLAEAKGARKIINLAYWKKMNLMYKKPGN